STSPSAAEANNSATTSVASTLASYADLQISGLTLAPSNPKSGTALTINWNDVNNGAAATPGSWYDRVIIQNTTTGQTYVNTIVYYDSSTLGNLAASGGSRARTYNFTLPDGDPGVGNIQATITADTLDNI